MVTPTLGVGVTAPRLETKAQKQWQQLAALHTHALGSSLDNHPQTFYVIITWKYDMLSPV